MSIGIRIISGHVKVAMRAHLQGKLAIYTFGLFFMYLYIHTLLRVGRY